MHYPQYPFDYKIAKDWKEIESFNELYGEGIIVCDAVAMLYLWHDPKEVRRLRLREYWRDSHEPARPLKLISKNFYVKLPLCELSQQHPLRKEK